MAIQPIAGRAVLLGFASAAATAFLLSEDASFIAGVELHVDGGMNQV